MHASINKIKGGHTYKGQVSFNGQNFSKSIVHFIAIILAFHNEWYIMKFYGAKKTIIV